VTRLLVAFAFLLASLAAIAAAFGIGADTPWGNVLINLGTEIFGILLTVALVQWILDRRRLMERAREVAWSTLHGVERAVWVWQGGPRQPSMDELLGLVAAIRPDDGMAPVTRTLLSNLGVQCREMLDREGGALKTVPGLTEALEELTSLRVLRDGGNTVSRRMVAEALDSSTRALARILGLPSQRLPGALVRYRDAAEEAQETRSFDLRMAPAAGEWEGRRGGGG
jgi:hypothetical protein